MSLCPLAAADTIVNEPMSSDFNGILGLALPLNSIIADSIPPVITNSPDGAAWASNLFSITPVAFAPSARFLSLSLSRPGSTQIPALLGIGRHPAALVPDASKIKYSTVIADRLGTLFWKSQVRGITVYVDGERREVEVGRSNTGAPWPSAVLDSGVPLILTTSRIANGIYGAIGIAPAQDGQCACTFVVILGEVGANCERFLDYIRLCAMRPAAQYDGYAGRP